jgi:hypothetical protein
MITHSQLALDDNGLSFSVELIMIIHSQNAGIVRGPLGTRYGTLQNPNAG